MPRKERPFFVEQWFNPPKRRRLLEAMEAVTATEGDIIEVGSWEGRSTIDIANFFVPANVIAIDHWKGDLTNLANGVAAIAARRDVFAAFKANMDAATKGNYVVARMDWRDYVWEGRIRFLFIDGQHTYNEVYDNIEVAIPLMVEGGVIAGDDYTVGQVERAAKRALGREPTHHGGPGAAIWWCRID